MVFDYETVPAARRQTPNRLYETLHRYSLASFAVLFLLVSTSAVWVGRAYWVSQIKLPAAARHQLHIPAQPAKGPNLIVASSDLVSTVARITQQPLDLTIGQKSVAISADTVKSWLQIVSDKQAGVSYIHVDNKAASKSLAELAAPFVKTPLNQVIVANADGSQRVIYPGRNGTTIGNTDTALGQISQGLLSAKGLQLNLPITTQAFGASTAADFDKLIEVNIVTKQMYLYDKGQLTHSYLISAGAPATPTPIGEFKIYQKLAVQDMHGFNANGTKYFQPHVHWINYFLPGGYAVHGVYWHPSSWFGAINSSHGCVGLLDNQAKEVYDWAPIGTTVITHT
jgi:lipoprotein-anchoring transpeptidase ErfK/SrfK